MDDTDWFGRFFEAMQRDWREIGAELMGLEGKARETGVTLRISKSANGPWQVSTDEHGFLAQDELAEFAFKLARQRLK